MAIKETGRQAANRTSHRRISVFDRPRIDTSTTPSIPTTRRVLSAKMQAKLARRARRAGF